MFMMVIVKNEENLTNITADVEGPGACDGAGGVSVVDGDVQVVLVLLMALRVLMVVLKNVRT
jgi:hypothetical protein